MLQSLIFAQESSSDGAGGLLSFLLIIGVLGGFFWFLIIRPQRRQMRRRQELVSSVEVGDLVRTGGGIYGVVRRIDDQDAVLEVEDGGKEYYVRVKPDGSLIQKLLRIPAIVEIPVD